MFIMIHHTLKSIKHHLRVLSVVLIAVSLGLSCKNDSLKNARELLENGDFLAARAIYERLVEKAPREFAPHYGLGMTWCAEAMYKTDIGLADPGDWYPAIYHMTVAAHINSLPEARSTLAILHFNLGACYKKQGAASDAILRIQQAVAYDSSLFKAWNLLGALYQEQGDLVDAENCYQRTIIINPDYAMSHFNLGALSWACKSYADAEKHFRDAATLEPGNSYFEPWLSRAREAASRVPAGSDR